MDYLTALELIHRIVAPRNYCEIGVRLGLSLALARSPAVGVDPNFEIGVTLTAPTRIFKQTSDAFFTETDVRALIGGAIDFAFIDGMHQVEFALRDFMNLERYAHEGAMIAIDDVLPGDMAYATRERNTQIWTGDVYRLLEILKSYRPGLDVRVYDVEMKGLAVITGLNPASTVLRDRYEELTAKLAAGGWQTPSPQALREQLKPRPVGELPRDLSVFAQTRKQPGTNAADPAALYLDLLKRSILNEIYLDDEARILYLRSCLAGDDTFDYAVLHDIRTQRKELLEDLEASRRVGQFVGRDIRKSGFSHSMMGRLRLDSLQECLDIVRMEGLDGDLAECGVWRGGGCILMAGYAAAYGLVGKRIFAADSFQGLPQPSSPHDAGLDLSKERFPELAVSLDAVRETFRAYGLDRPNVQYLPGWFKDSLPAAPISRLALLRMDGDLYESTIDILSNLYDKVVPGGIVVVDDYGAIEACRLAIRDFFQERGPSEPAMQEIDWTGVWFRKSPA